MNQTSMYTHYGARLTHVSEEEVKAVIDYFARQVESHEPTKDRIVDYLLPRMKHNWVDRSLGEVFVFICSAAC
jgi:hypothetical protein